MPQTRLERVAAVTGVAAIVALVAIIVPMWQRYRDSEAPARRSLPAPTHPVARPSRAAAPAPTHPAPAPTPHFALTASGGSCWLEVHLASSQGKLLYQGLLTDGRTVTVAGRRLWIRAGAGDFLQITRDGKKLGGVPRGTVDIVVARTGVHPANA